jgi:hypothetical protein
MRSILATALLAATLALPLAAGQVELTRSIEAGSLHEGPLDMVVYWVEAADDHMEVTATFMPRAYSPTSTPMRVVMAMADGDNVAFSMPGFSQALYRFTRSGGRVVVSVRPAPAEAAF